jgi:membrane protease YdiL (CAAX protease family)
MRFPRRLHAVYPIFALGAFIVLRFWLRGLFVIAAVRLHVPQLAVVLIAQYLAYYIAIFAILLVFERRPPWTAGLDGQRWLFNYLRGLAVGLAMFGMVAAALILTGQAGVVVMQAGAIGWTLLLLPAWAFQSTAEELLARGFLIQEFGRHYGVAVGIVAGTATFTLLHRVLQLPLLLTLAAWGLFLSFWALKEGAIWGVSGWHTAWNWAEGFLGFSVTGGALPVSAQLAVLRMSGGQWATGGQLGPENGWAATSCWERPPP